jgi:hypothetical protein
MLSPEKQSAPTANWDSVVLLSLIEIADKVINDSRVKEWNGRIGSRPDTIKCDERILLSSQRHRLEHSADLQFYPQ